jgi:hypothetical protein
LSDLNPLVGEHWIQEQFNRSPVLDLARPAYLMFYPMLGADSMALVGVGYTVAQPAGSPEPDGFAGTTDRWHVHLPCAGVPDLQGILAESVAECEEVGGTPAQWQIAMVHVWLVPNPDGPFGQFNPALPFRATSIDPPTARELADSSRGPLLRALGMALGETFGAVPRLGGSIAQDPDSAFADQVRPYRERIAALLPTLREARAGLDSAVFLEAARDMTGAWRAIGDAYLEHAPSTRHRLILDRWFAAALAGHHTTQLHSEHQ